MKKERTKTVTLRIPQSKYEAFRRFAHRDDRPISNFIEVSAWRHLEECTWMDEAEEKEILSNRTLMAKIRRGIRQGEKLEGSFVG